MLWNLNHVQCETTGEVRLTQIILWDFGVWKIGKDINAADYAVVDWCLPKDATTIHRQGSRWVGVFKGRWVRARIFIETWTTFDPEIEDQKTFPSVLRRGVQ